MALLDSVQEAFADRNVPLHLLLGMISIGRRLDRYLPDRPERQSPPRPERGDEPRPAAARAPRRPEPGEQLLYSILGVISIRRVLMAELEAVRAGRAAPGPPPAPPVLRGRRLLR